MINVWPCSLPPHPSCQPGKWFRYSVTTQSGRNSASGYKEGDKKVAYAEARSVLQRLELFEGPRRAWESFSMRACDMRPSSIQKARVRSREMRALLDARL